MAKVPKKIVERFTRSVARFQKVLQIAKDRDVNESDTVAIINDILGDVFGYDKYLEVTSEFSIRNTFCDLALKVNDKAEFLLEAKAIGIDLKENHVKQAIDYGSNHGVQWIILTNSIEWRLYRIRFEKPINYDLLFTFDFTQLNPRDEKDQELLFTLSRESLDKNAREDFYEKVQSVNRYVIGNLILTESVLTILRRELKKIADGMKIDNAEVEEIIRNEVLKREIVDGEAAKTAQHRINKFYRKGSSARKRMESNETVAQKEPATKPEESISERLLREADQA